MSEPNRVEVWEADWGDGVSENIRAFAYWEVVPGWTAKVTWRMNAGRVEQDEICIRRTEGSDPRRPAADAALAKALRLGWLNKEAERWFRSNEAAFVLPVEWVVDARRFSARDPGATERLSSNSPSGLAATSMR